MRKLIPTIPGLLVILGLSACSWMGLGSSDEERRDLASLRTPIADEGEMARDEETLSYEQVINCRINATGPVQFQRDFKFHLNLEQLRQASWAGRINVGNGLEVYVNLWSFHEYTLGLKDVRAPASTESRLAETKGVWSPSYERTMGDLTKIRFQSKLFHHAGAQSYEVRCPE